jgi:hypothetical protein
VKRVFMVEGAAAFPTKAEFINALYAAGASSVTELDLDAIKREARIEVEALLRRCVIELVYINDGVENCDSGLCATGEGKECISEAVRLLGPVATWPEIGYGHLDEIKREARLEALREVLSLAEDDRTSMLVALWVRSKIAVAETRALIEEEKK